VGGQLRRRHQLSHPSSNGGGRYYVGSESAMPDVAVHDNDTSHQHDNDTSHGGGGGGGGRGSVRGDISTPANGGYNGERGTSGGNQLASYQTSSGASSSSSSSSSSSHELFHPPPDYNAQQQQQQQTANVMLPTPLTSCITPPKTDRVMPPYRRRNMNVNYSYKTRRGVVSASRHVWTWQGMLGVSRLSYRRILIQLVGRGKFKN